MVCQLLWQIHDLERGLGEGLFEFAINCSHHGGVVSRHGGPYVPPENSKNKGCQRALLVHSEILRVSEQVLHLLTCFVVLQRRQFSPISDRLQSHSARLTKQNRSEYNDVTFYEIGVLINRGDSIKPPPSATVLHNASVHIEINNVTN